MTKQNEIKKLYLSTNNQILTGLCGGLAEYFKIDASLVRLVWIIVTVVTGILPGVFAYIIASVVIPSDLERGKEVSSDTYR